MKKFRKKNPQVMINNQREREKESMNVRDARASQVYKTLIKV